MYVYIYIYIYIYNNFFKFFIIMLFLFFLLSWLVLFYCAISTRFWQELGYLIIYISGRPDVQKDDILNFLGRHAFPLGLVICAQSFSTDTHSMKTAFLARLIKLVSLVRQRVHEVISRQLVGHVISTCGLKLVNISIVRLRYT